ncbi:MAG: hypothetical protein LBS70_07995 [Candidatus Accumulibacter sp.]|jgi:hypothetical protein|nr:hypothetical protein [Accumulibacter sp.]
MKPELITDWAEHDRGVRQVLLRAGRAIRVFDADLARLRLETPEINLFLRRFLAAARINTLEILLRNADPFRNASPRLFKLLADFPQTVHVWECAPRITPLTDAMLITDGCHALIRIHEDHARSRLILDDPAACRPYLMRFDEILAEGVTPISATTLGL